MKPRLFALLLFLLPALIFAQVKKPILSGAEKLGMYEKHEQMRSESPFHELHWHFIGPTNISGRCTDVEAVGPKRKKLYHLGGHCLFGCLEEHQRRGHL